MTFLYKIGGFLLAVGVAVLSTFKWGQSSQREKQATKAAAQARRANEIDDDVRHAGASSVRKRLRDYQRK